MCNFKFKIRLALGLLIGATLFPATTFAAATISSIGFKTVGGNSQLDIQADGPITFETQENAQDKQIVIEVKGSKLGPKAKRKLDTSSFNSIVSLVSPYQVKDQPDTVRVVIQMRDMASADVTQANNDVKVVIPNAGGAAPKSAASTGSAPGNSAGNTQIQPVSQTQDAAPETPITDSNAAADKTNLDQFMDTAQTKRFTGKPITLQVRDAELSDVFRLIGEASGFNIIVGDNVGGKITLSLVDVPWDQALDVILHTKRLGAERKGNILRIATLTNLTAEKEELLKAKDAAQRSAPRVTKIFPISYAEAKDLVPILNNFGKNGPATNNVGGAQQASGPGGAAAQQTGGPVQVDSRTNSLIVQDIPENIERMKKLIELLDTQTPQVMVEAKVVEASENFGKSMQGSLGASHAGNPQTFASFNGANPVDPLLGGVFPAGSNIASTSVNGSGQGLGSFGFSPSISFIPGLSRLNALLNLGESEGQTKVLASPKLVVLNKKQATILQGTPVLVPQTQNVPGLPSSTITVPQNANLSLDVTPTVTNSGSVSMVLKIQRDLPLANLVAPRNMNTEVLVDSGSTLVIGGIYTTQVDHTESGFPVLRKIPILGWLFGSSTDNTVRSELFIFITPRVINEEEAGFSG